MSIDKTDLSVSIPKQRLRDLNNADLSALKTGKANQQAVTLDTSPSMDHYLQGNVELTIPRKKKGPRISDFKHSLVTGANTSAESGSLPYLNQRHLFKNVNAQASQFEDLIE